MGTWGRLLAVSLLCACGKVEGGGDDAGSDAPPQPQSTKLVIDFIDVPEIGQEAAALGLDLDGDSTPDNAVGAALVMVRELLSPQQATDAAIAAGSLLQLVEIRSVDRAEDPAAEVRLFIGADADQPPDPSNNFTGSGSFTIAPGTPTNSLLPGSIAGGQLAAGPGPAPLQIAVFLEARSIALNLVGARVEASVDPETGALTGGRIGGGIPELEAEQVLIPAIAESCAAIVARDCPNNQCVPGSAGEQLLAAFDLDGDGQITVAEIRDNELIQASMAPDLDLFDASGAFNPNADGINESLSIGLGFTAVGAEFSAP